MDYISQEVGRGLLELPFTSALPSNSYNISIVQDGLTEMQESFFALIRGYDVYDLNGNMLTLTDDERQRISFSVNTAQVFLDDNDSKLFSLQIIIITVYITCFKNVTLLFNIVVFLFQWLELV